MSNRWVLKLIAGFCIILLVGCTTRSPTVVSVPTARPVQVPTATPVVIPVKNPGLVPGSNANSRQLSISVPALAPGEFYLYVDKGTRAAYMVQEQLARLDFPTDAVGVTDAVEGGMVVGPGNAVESHRSKFTVDLKTLKSDKDRRDRFVRQNTLETRIFPAAEFVPREIVGLPGPMPDNGKVEFQLVGDLIVHGVTSPVTWDVVGSIGPEKFIGEATTYFGFGKFGLIVPKLFFILSIDDNIRLKLDLVLGIAR